MLQPLRLGVLLTTLISISPVALAQTVSPSAPVSSDGRTAPSLNSAQPNGQAGSRLEGQNLSDQPPICPAGYFASKFSDVTPDDWAYQAVNRLADREFRCFPLSSQDGHRQT